VKLADGRRRELLLGPHGSPESWEEYNRILKLIVPPEFRPGAEGNTEARPFQGGRLKFDPEDYHSDD
jgi:hypothetical protein